MSETINTSQENKSEKKDAPGHPLTPEIIRKFFKLFNELGSTVKYIDVVTINGDPRRITRHPADKFLLKIAGPRFTDDLDPLNPATSREFFILDDTLAEVDKDSTDEGIERIKIKAKLHNSLPYCVRAQGADNY